MNNRALYNARFLKNSFDTPFVLRVLYYAKVFGGLIF